jgi:hypothetical protein
MPGVDQQRVGQVLIRASGASLILERKLSALVVHDYRAGFDRLDSSFGTPDIHWIRVIVDPDDPNVFTFKPRDRQEKFGGSFETIA